MKAQHTLLASIFSLFLLGSCTSEWLEPEQPSKLDPNNAYSTYTGCMGLVTYLLGHRNIADATFCLRLLDHILHL